MNQNENENKNAIVILNYNDWNTTIDMVKQIKDYRVLDYIIIVDNCSLNESVNKLKEYCGDNIILLEARQNGGYSAGNNIGARYAVEKLNVSNVVISNPDIQVDELSIKKILGLLNDEDVGVATGVIHNKDKNGNYKVFSSFGWKIPNYGDMLSNCFLTIYKIRRTIFHNSIYYDYSILLHQKLVRVEAVSGCFFAIRADVLKKIGFFDERTFLYYEETILGYSLKEKGYKVMIDSSAKIYHCEDPNKGKTLHKKIEIDKIALKSADVYLLEYLKVTGLKKMVFHICFWLGKIETKILCFLFKR